MKEKLLDQSMGGKYKVDNKGSYLVDPQTGGKFRPLDIYFGRLVVVNDTILQQRRLSRAFKPTGSERIYSPIS